ncbi:MAG: hypothetical protein ACTHKL_05810, partial [Streptosporangiaceae bacterium]
RWLVHHLASDLPVEEVIRLADQASVRLVVLSSAMSQTARQAQNAAAAIASTHPRLMVLAGGPGDRLHDLLTQAAKPREGGGNRTQETRA